jgi:hypothetical protein
MSCFLYAKTERNRFLIQNNYIEPDFGDEIIPIKITYRGCEIKIPSLPNFEKVSTLHHESLSC